MEDNATLISKAISYPDSFLLSVRQTVKCK